MGRHLNFPDPGDRSANEPTTACSAERMVKLYNQAKGGDAKNVSKTVREWFEAEAKSRGWVGIHFMNECQTKVSAGCLLWTPVKHGALKLTDQMLVLVPSS